MDAIERLIAGFKRFQGNYFGVNRWFFDVLANKQHPRTLVIACCDSRVDPAVVTSCEPGELFVVRNVANLVPPYESDGGQYHGTSAALEFGVCGLQVENIIVMGHAMCGGVKALLKGGAACDTQGSFVGAWMSIAHRARVHVLREMGDAPSDEQERACEKASILVSLDNLMTFPWIREKVTQGKLRIHGWYFNITTGELQVYDPASNEFKEV
jgi:carbonic anhydrase